MGEAKKLFPERMRLFRTRAQLSQEELAAKIGKKRVTISTWETGAHEPSLNDLAAMARIFACSVDALLGLEPEPPCHGQAAMPWVSELIPDLAALDKAGRDSVRALVRGLKKDCQ